MRPPLLALVLLFSLATSSSAKDSPLEPVPLPPAPLKLELELGPEPAGIPKPLITASPEMIKALAAAGWKARDAGDLVKLSLGKEPPAAEPIVLQREAKYIPVYFLERADFRWHDGRIVYTMSRAPVEDDILRDLLDSLAAFAAAGAKDPREVGKALAAWGLPPAFDGKKLLNPDGTPTYYGLMLYELFSSRPDALKKVTTQRLKEALEVFDEAYSQAFSKQAPDIGRELVKRAWSILTLDLAEGDKAMALKPYKDLGEALSGYQAAVKTEAGLAVTGSHIDGPRAAEANTTLAALNALEKQRYHSTLDIQPIPAPGTTHPMPDAKSPPLSTSMPTVLSMLERLNGKPLTPQEQESLIKSFPMGELVWQLQAQELWRDGLRGQGVKVAVIDSGVANNPELDGAVKSRQNMTRERGDALRGNHGTHVAGIIHQIAPEAEINSYMVGADGAHGNPRLRGTFTESVRAAVRKAVSDGNHVVNLSLNLGNQPMGDVVSLVNEYSAQGVIFVISAGNARDNGVGNPSVAPDALTSGALNVNNRMADFSSFGVNPNGAATVIKRIFLTPGDNVVSTLPTFPGMPAQYGPMSGSSMSSPALAGVTGLLLQSVRSFTPVPDPVSASLRVREALTSTSRRMSSTLLTDSAPSDQQFLIVDADAANQRLKAPVAAR